MIIIFCGENTSESRKQFVAYKESLQAKGFEMHDIEVSGDIDIPQLLQSQSLFQTRIAFAGENISSKKETRAMLIAASEHAEIILWEEKYSDKDLAKYYKMATIKNSKLPHSLWTLLDELRPGNLKKIYSMFETLKDSVDEYMLLFMMQRRAKELLLTVDPAFATKVAPWQAGKLKKQASYWDTKTLTGFYRKLIDIERTTKTDTSPYTIRQLLDILGCFYLQ